MDLQSSQKLCQLCVDSLEESYLLEDCGDFSSFQKTLSFELNSSSIICSKCSTFVKSLLKFIEQCERSHQFLNYVANLPDPLDLETAKKDFGFDGEKEDQDFGIQYGIKDEFIDTQIQEETFKCESDNFNELEGFSEIALPEPENDNFVIDELDDGMEENPKTQENIDEDVMKLSFLCQICQENCKNFYALQKHCKKEHDSSPEIVCSCGTTLSSRAQIQVHRKLHDSEKSFACNQCDSKFSYQQSLQSHVKRTHPEFMCKICPKKFESELSLRVHEQVHLPDEKKYKVSCPYCDKKFTKNVNVQAHIKSIHHMERPYLCSDCGKDFSTKGALKEHQIIHSDNYPFQCSFCPKKFKNLPRLKTHEDIHNETQYICNICGISLNTKRTLKMHMVVHDDQKKYKCQYCGSSFKRSKALKNHLILHSGLRPYACPWCDKTFANGSNCRSHKKKAHPNELSALEASGKSIIATPKIPRLEQLQPKDPSLLPLDGSNLIIHSLPAIKNELPSLQVIQHPQSFQVQNVIPITTSLLDSHSQT